MKHKNIAIFVPHAGCPHACAFCNQKTITAQEEMPHAADVQRICAQAYVKISDRRNTEVAFFGGSFTAIPREYMLELLEAVQPFLGEYGFSGIRISTRPDYISRGVLTLLKDYGVTAIELGAQSMCDHVLTANDRGHTAQDVVNACRLIREYGFELGLQVMIGLYKSSWDDEWHTIEQVITLHPDTVRIYPVVILKGTKLARLYEAGEYQILCDDVTALTADFMERCMEVGIRIIKVGLHASEFVEQDMVGGYYHPAFRELCESMIFRKRMLAQMNDHKSNYTFAVHPSCVSKAVGQNRGNIRFFAEQKMRLNIIADACVKPFECELRE